MSERRKKEYLINNFARQKEKLKKRFDLKSHITIINNEIQSQDSYLNFAENLSPPSPEEVNSITEGEETITSQKNNSDLSPIAASPSQLNFKNLVIDGEDISSFPPEWQEFFQKHEGKPIREKLNKMIEKKNLS